MNQSVIVPKWQKKWAEAKLFDTSDKSKKPKFYNLEMFPYPSASGLHMGHVRNYSIGDTIARYKRMRGFNVLYPMGFDAFGLPAENAAIKNKTHPRLYTEKAITSLTNSMKRLGLSYDWNKTLATCYPEYYRWNQLFFLRFLEKGLAYRKTAPINWCPSCKTVLANEQVTDNRCWRCESTVEIKDLEQWFFRITKYAEELLDGVDSLNWPDRIKTMQRNWIGKSVGTQIDWMVKDSNTKLTVFTTRPDTVFGVSCLVIAPEHPIVQELVKGKPIAKEVDRFVNNVLLQEKFSRASESKEKEGMFIECYAVHPFTGKDVPVYIANFVLMDYGTGIIMAVPAHDTRDYDFAKKYSLPIVQVIKPAKEQKLPFVDEGTLIDSGEFTGVASETARASITKSLTQKKIGRATTNYKIRDWLLSRQRYWGTPIPIVYCAKCGIVPVPEKDLPILLPEKAEFTGQGDPLANTPEFVNTHCPKCKGPAKRETDTMDTFVDSAWYYLRYTSPKELKQPFDKDAVKYWMPVNQYIGGAEHAVSHLLFARFFCKALRDLGFIDIDEPFQSLVNQGMVCKDGAKMSKSPGHVVAQE
ncbi:MAG: leucine--tRNA ligase, partial [Nanoarchaeota archaeon]